MLPDVLANRFSVSQKDQQPRSVELLANRFRVTATPPGLLASLAQWLRRRSESRR